MTGYIYDADGNRVAKGSITSMSCDPSTNGFTTESDYVRDQAGNQLTELTADSRVPHVSQRHGFAQPDGDRDAKPSTPEAVKPHPPLTKADSLTYKRRELPSHLLF